LKKRYKGREDKDEDVGSYRETLGKREDNGNLNRKH
jgi:hypothetical protein